MPTSVRPRAASEIPSSACSSGSRGVHDDSVAPLTKNTAPMASGGDPVAGRRARRERVRRVVRHGRRDDLPQPPLHEVTSGDGGRRRARCRGRRRALPRHAARRRDAAGDHRQAGGPAGRPRAPRRLEGARASPPTTSPRPTASSTCSSRHPAAAAAPAARHRGHGDHRPADRAGPRPASPADQARRVSRRRAGGGGASSRRGASCRRPGGAGRPSTGGSAGAAGAAVRWPPATSAASRSSAASRLRSCERRSDAVTVIVAVDERRAEAPAGPGPLGRRSSAAERSRSHDSSTRESVVLTCWPPAPDDRENRHASSAAGDDDAGRDAQVVH